MAEETIWQALDFVDWVEICIGIEKSFKLTYMLSSRLGRNIKYVLYVAFQTNLGSLKPQALQLMLKLPAPTILHYECTTEIHTL